MKVPKTHIHQNTSHQAQVASIKKPPNSIRPAPCLFGISQTASPLRDADSRGRNPQNFRVFLVFSFVFLALLPVADTAPRCSVCSLSSSFGSPEPAVFPVLNSVSFLMGRFIPPCFIFTLRALSLLVFALFARSRVVFCRSPERRPR